jgi:Holliday junction resolvase-like predicted endonuclease
MNTTSVGQKAETAAAAHLVLNGYIIVDRNWRTPTCEIDIIARRGSQLYFVEVKYRFNDRQGTGFDYIIPAKIFRMRYAAELWLAKHGWRSEYTLSGASVSGQKFQVQFIESIV